MASSRNATGTGFSITLTFGWSSARICSHVRRPPSLRAPQSSWFPSRSYQVTCAAYDMIAAAFRHVPVAGLTVSKRSPAMSTCGAACDRAIGANVAMASSRAKRKRSVSSNRPKVRPWCGSALWTKRSSVSEEPFGVR